MPERFTPTHQAGVRHDFKHQAFHAPVAWRGRIKGVIVLGFTTILPLAGPRTERDTDADNFDTADIHRSVFPIFIGFVGLP